MKSEITTITNERFASFCETLSEQAKTRIYEEAEDMLASWHTSSESKRISDFNQPSLPGTETAKGKKGSSK